MSIKRKKIAGARFSIGQIVDHKLLNYRGVIADVDPSYQDTDIWYESTTKSWPPKDAPWYQVLVDNADAAAYVSECNLIQSALLEPVTHPLIDVLFHGFTNGHYLYKNNTI